MLAVCQYASGVLVICGSFPQRGRSLSLPSALPLVVGDASAERMGKHAGGSLGWWLPKAGRPDGLMEGLHGETYAECWGGRGAIWLKELFADAAAHADGQTWEMASGDLPGQMHGRLD